MRAAFFDSLLSIFREQKEVVVLTGDLGYKLFDPFKDADPSRFYNVGVAEANMIGIAAGLALCGKKVYCYSIAPFLVMRPFEQIRIDVAYHNLDVKLVGVGGGFAYGLEGTTHHALEDIELMRVLPNMTVAVPADPIEAGCFARLSCLHSGPMYIRLGHTNEPRIHDGEPAIEIGKAMVLAEGRDAAVFATGRMVKAASQAINILEREGLSISLINMHTIKPMDRGAVIEQCDMHEAVFTVEEHGLEGGLGTAIAEVVAETSYSGIFRRIGIDRKKKYIGHADYLREQHGLSAEGIAETIRKTLSGRHYGSVGDGR